MPVVSTTKMTASQFLELGEDPPGVRLELVDGEVAVSPSPTPEHSNIDTELRILVGTYVKARDLGKVFGDVDTIFGENDVRRPDLIYFSKKRLHLIGKKAMEGPPDLCIEIVSPSSSTVDRVDKFEQYEAGGVAHYWVVDPRDRSIEGYKLRRGKYVPTGSGRGNDVVRLPPFPKLDIPLGQLWLGDFRNGQRRR
jgi:Uma2 family endonuclease